MESASGSSFETGQFQAPRKSKRLTFSPTSNQHPDPVGIPHPAHSQSSEFFREHQDKPLSRRPRKRFGQACCPVWLFCRVRKVQKRAVDDFAGSYKIQRTAARIYLAMRWYASSKRIVTAAWTLRCRRGSAEALVAVGLASGFRTRRRAQLTRNRLTIACNPSASSARLRLAAVISPVA